QGLTTTAKHRQDARVNLVQLSDVGKQLVPRLDRQCADVDRAVEELLSEAQHNLYTAIAEVEFLLGDKNFFERVQRVRKVREQKSVEIVDYAPEFQNDFKRLNYEWIEKYFKVEATDREYLEYPGKKILEPGGYIFMARYHNEIVGTCALAKMNKRTYELAKMAVTEKAKGKGIGSLLGKAAISKARELGADTVFIESNTALKAAISLYQKLGFRKVLGQPSPYERCNIQLELKLD
ncbi:MAG: GNAT family N-acetyltransferase, partial [Cyanobacteria bacterium P01_H01_bin.58]